MNYFTNLKEIYEHFGQMVYNLCLNYLQNKEEAEEATQDVFLKVHRHVDGFQRQAELKTWIYRISINTCLDIIRSRKKKSSLKLVFSKYFSKENSAIDFYHPGVELENREAVAQIFEKINLLPENQKTALLLKVMEDLSQKEIAATMEISEKAVESLLSRARANLKKMLPGTKDGKKTDV